MVRDISTINHKVIENRDKVTIQDHSFLLVTTIMNLDFMSGYLTNESCWQLGKWDYGTGCDRLPRHVVIGYRAADDRGSCWR